MIVSRNRHVVVPGRVYRTGQLTPAQLEAFVHRYGVRTVINLRGRPFDAWYPAEMRATQELGISQEDVTTSANRLPSPGEIRRLIEVFDRSEHPLVIHCQQGADRTGLAAAMYQLLYTDASYDAARRQCSPRYGHLRIHTAAAMDEFFDRYEAWLAATRRNPFAGRLPPVGDAEVYCPGPNRRPAGTARPDRPGGRDPAAGVHRPGVQYQPGAVAPAGRVGGRGARLLRGPGPGRTGRLQRTGPGSSTAQSRPAGTSIWNCRFRPCTPAAGTACTSIWWHGMSPSPSTARRP